MCRPVPPGSYHINQEHLLVERDEDAGATTAGKQGRSSSPTLGISPCPLSATAWATSVRSPLRAAAVEGRCRLQEFVGRTGEIFRTRDDG